MSQHQIVTAVVVAVTLTVVAVWVWRAVRRPAPTPDPLDALVTASEPQLRRFVNSLDRRCRARVQAQTDRWLWEQELADLGPLVDLFAEPAPAHSREVSL